MFFRVFLFLISMTAGSAGMAAEVAPCSGDTVPIQIMIPAYSGSNPKRSAAEIEALPHFRAFVSTVEMHISARLTREKLCITGAEYTENMPEAAMNQRSLLQFVYWPLVMHKEYVVSTPPIIGGMPFSCRISSPWIDLTLARKPIPSVHGVIRWSERQLLADQAALSGARNVSMGMAMPLKPNEFNHFLNEYRKSAAKPLEIRIPPDMRWLLHRSLSNLGQTFQPSGWINDNMRIDDNRRNATKKGAEGYMNLVLALIDRCFDASLSGGVELHYSGILDIDDPVLLKQYKIDSLRRSY